MKPASPETRNDTTPPTSARQTAALETLQRQHHRLHLLRAPIDRLVRGLDRTRISAFTRICSPPTSRANALVKPINAALEVT